MEKAIETIRTIISEKDKTIEQLNANVYALNDKIQSNDKTIASLRAEVSELKTKLANFLAAVKGVEDVKKD